ncbi:WD40-repeat-containing domain protein [Mycena pura]|uniref:WD40-repeat-containing domain protein n=1 Tax=Mycena pura TaxID=153505 RepID=A0AAD6V3G0_9AGAR|nr:WD40-repeat-containing domain protein [Mycena pura]
MAQHRTAHGSSSLADALDIIKAEFELLSAEVAVARRERDECETALTVQVNELNLIRQSLYELETQHGKLRHQYEEDLARLRAELHGVRQAMVPPAHRPPPVPMPDQRAPERDRDRDRERDRLLERERIPDRDRERMQDRERDRDPKRLKAERGRAVPVPLIPPSPPAAALLDDLDLASMPPHLKKESPASSQTGTEWFAVWNPSVKHKRIGDINLLHTLLHESVVCCVRFSKDGRFLATGCNRTAQVYDARTGAKVCALMDPSVPKAGDLYIRSVCFSPDGALLATGAEDTQIRIWDIGKKRIIAVLAGHQQEIYALDFSADGRFVVSGSGDKTVRIWDMRGIAPGAPAPSSPPTCQVLAITDTAPMPARSSPAPTHDGGVTSVAINPAGTRVAAGALDALVRVWDVRNGALVRCLRGHGDSVYSVAFMPEAAGTPRGIALVSGGLDRTVRGWDLGSVPTPAPSPAVQGWKEQTPQLQGWKEGGGATTPSGSTPASGGVFKGPGRKEGDDEGRCTMTYTGHKDYVLSVAVSHDGEWVVSGSKDRGVQFWDAKTGVVQCMLQGHKNSVISIDLSPAGNLLATGSGDWHTRICLFFLLQAEFSVSDMNLVAGSYDVVP